MKIGKKNERKLHKKRRKRPKKLIFLGFKLGRRKFFRRGKKRTSKEGVGMVERHNIYPWVCVCLKYPMI